VPRIVTPLQGCIVCVVFLPGLRCRSGLGYYITPFQGWLELRKLISLLHKLYLHSIVCAVQDDGVDQVAAEGVGYEGE
jgi:hypothetical protein